MAIDGGTIHVIVTSAFCFILISFRCGYRLLSNCRIHTSCHRTWHQDDVWMGLAIFPLTARAVCVGLYDNLTAKTNITPAEAVVAMKLLIPARIFYCLVEWCFKMCIVTFYFRLASGSTYMQEGSKLTFWAIILTFWGVVLATLLECRPLSLFWTYHPSHSIPCQEGLANLLTMAISNIVTDIALILLPIPMLCRMTLSLTKKTQLILLFSVGIFVIGVTTARLPLIFDHSVDQSSRSLWASIEIATSCLVANFAFYYAQLKDMRDGHLESGAARSPNATCHDTSASKSFDLIDKKGTWRSDTPLVEQRERWSLQFQYDR